MLSDVISLDKNATPDTVVYTGVTAGEYKTIRKDVSGTYPDLQTLTISQQYNENTGVRRGLVRFDRKPDPTATVPDPRNMSLYVVFDYEDKDHPDAAADIEEMATQMVNFLISADVTKVIAGQH